MPDFKNQLAAKAAQLGLKVDLAEEVRPETVDSTNAQTVINLRQQYGEKALANYTDQQLLVTYADWTLSEDYENVDTFLTWLDQRYNPQPGETAHDDGTNSADGNVPTADVAETISAEAEAEVVPAPGVIDPLDLNPEPTTLEDFTPRQHLAVLTDLLRERRTNELTQMIADILGNVTRMQITTETDAIVVVTENAKLTDYVLAVFRLLDVAPVVAKLDRSTMMVGDVRVDFNRKTPRFSLTELEQGMIAAFKTIHDLRNQAATVPALNKQLEARTNDIAGLNQRIAALTAAKEAAEAQLAALNSQPKAVPLVNSDGAHFVQVRWTVDVTQDDGSTKSTLFYLAVEEGAERNEKGIFKTASFRRTKDREKALSFGSVQEARDTIARMLKNSKHLDKKSKVTERALKNANVVQLMELEG